MRQRVYLYDAIASNRRRIALGVLVFFLVVLVESLIVAASFTRWIAVMFHTHPRVEDRLERLESMV